MIHNCPGARQSMLSSSPLSRKLAPEDLAYGERGSAEVCGSDRAISLEE
jgi:hypothetical protein